MSREVLIKDLRAKGEGQIAEIWRETRAEVERFRAEQERRLAGEHDRCYLAEREVRKSVLRRRTMAARRQCETLVIRTEEELHDRMFILARKMLGGEWVGDRQRFLARLAGELPPGDWGRIRVNPADHEAARNLFPKAEIVGDPEIPGGLEAAEPDGSVSIDNTLTTRLLRAWPRLVPELLREAKRHAETG
jgi:vacuolar-type H+-ATPase subunit E/Vma4